MAHPIPRRLLGRTGEQVACLGLGGYHLGTIEEQSTITNVVHGAIDAGVTFMDNAWDYHDGRSETVMGEALRGGWRDKVFLMTKCCTHGRGRDVAMRQLEESLRRLGTDRLDLWQIHEVVYGNDPELHFAADGAIEALDQAKREGKVRFVGFTGHKDPDLHLAMLSRGYAFDTCQMPLNVWDASFRSFEQRVLPEVLRQGIAPIGMKPFSGDGAPVKKGAVSAEDALRYAMSLPVAVTVTGIDSPAILRQALGIARGFEPMTEPDMQRVRAACREQAQDGRHELYKTTAKHEGAEGRRQHGFPSESEMAG